jgi:hypothetical protein
MLKFSNTFQVGNIPYFNKLEALPQWDALDIIATSSGPENLAPKGHKKD